MRDLRLTIVQSMLHWEDAATNRAMFAGLLAPLRGTTDLVVLPEMCTTGFSMRSDELAEGMDGPTVAWMREEAHRMDAAIYGSAIIRAGTGLYNRGLFVTPDGTVHHYDKRHLFRMADEQQHYAAGRRRTVVEFRDWRILLQVCYDLRFPVFSRNRNDYDLALYVANWPEPRRHAWSSLLRARAIENLACVVGVNRVGMDGRGHHYTGDSVVLDHRGEELASVPPATEGLAHVTLSSADLLAFREKFPAHLDADEFTILGL
jgi:predicted amidohydrolase